MAAEQIDFGQILASLLSGDNAIRQSAEVSAKISINYQSKSEQYLEWSGTI